MSESRTYRRIVLSGMVALALIAASAVIGRLIFLQNEFDLVTFLDDSAGIAPSSPVLLHGIAIGHVRAVSLSGSSLPDRIVRIDMRFRRRFLAQIPEDSTIAIAAANLLGDKSLDISRGVHARSIAPGAEIRSTATQDIGSVLERGNQPLKKVDSILDHVDRILLSIDKKEGAAGLLVNDRKVQNGFEGIADDFARIQQDLATGRGALLRVAELQAAARKPVAEVNAMVANLDQGKGSVSLFLHDHNSPTLTELSDATIKEGGRLMDDFSKDQRPGDAMKRIQATTDKAGKLAERVQTGQGTLGLLLSDREVRESLAATTTEFNSFVADFEKHPRSFFALRFGLF